MNSTIPPSLGVVTNNRFCTQPELIVRLIPPGAPRKRADALIRRILIAARTPDVRTAECVLPPGFPLAGPHDVLCRKTAHLHQAALEADADLREHILSGRGGVAFTIEWCFRADPALREEIARKLHTDRESAPDMLTRREAARLLRRSPKTITRLIRSGTLPGVRYGRDFFVPAERVKTLAEKGWAMDAEGAEGAA